VVISGPGEERLPGKKNLNSSEHLAGGSWKTCAAGFKEYAAMGMFSPDFNNLRDLYLGELKRALNMERQLVDKGLPAMIEKSSSPDLAQAFRQHLEETKTHVSRLERILNQGAGEVSDSKCKAMSSLIDEASSDISSAKNEGIRDVVLIAAGNQVEHHEIAIYGTLRTWAEVLGQNEDATQLEKTLKEEENADEILTRLSQQINVAAPVS
jgi:ferritin-like metal-binding protein YciE